MNVSLESLEQNNAYKTVVVGHFCNRKEYAKHRFAENQPGTHFTIESLTT